MSETFEVMAVRTSLRKMFQPDSHFSICTVDACLKALGCTPPPQQEYEALRCLHCINWRDMAPELRRLTLERVLAIFNTPGLDISVFDDPLVVEPEKPKSLGMMERILVRVTTR